MTRPHIVAKATMSAFEVNSKTKPGTSRLPLLGYIPNWQLDNIRDRAALFSWISTMTPPQPKKFYQMIYTGAALGIAMAGFLGWNLIARGAYESAEYKVIQSDGSFEVREYPDLMLAATSTNLDSQGRDGSFMKLFRYISGANESSQKIEMTTPVFMEKLDEDATVQMGFVMPKGVADKGVPKPTGEKVEVRKRPAGRFAVVRFAGQLTTQRAKDAEAKLRDWMASKGLAAADSVAGRGVETAGYDPPFTPGPLRRNEVLIRLKEAE